MSDGQKLASYVLVYDPMADVGLVGPFYGTEDDPNETAIVWALRWQNQYGSEMWEIFAEIKPEVLEKFKQRPLRKP